MEVLYVIIPVILIYIIYQIFIIPYMINKKMMSLLMSLNEGYTFRRIKNELYHYQLQKGEITYLINVCLIPANSTVTINSRDTWSLTWGGNPQNKGRAYRHQRYLNELIPFLRKDYDEHYLKVIVLYPHTENILRYLNESDLEIVKPSSTPYGYKVTSFSKLIEDLKIYEGGF